MTVHHLLQLVGVYNFTFHLQGTTRLNRQNISVTKKMSVKIHEIKFFLQTSSILLNKSDFQNKKILILELQRTLSKVY